MNITLMRLDTMREACRTIRDLLEEGNIPLKEATTIANRLGILKGNIAILYGEEKLRTSDPMRSTEQQESELTPAEQKVWEYMTEHGFTGKELDYNNIDGINRSTEGVN